MTPDSTRKHSRMELRHQILKCYENFTPENHRRARDSIKELRRLTGDE
ncbi:MAG: hypothetical protein GYA24_01740 [Candidatus Lokiarchaeota archaeon]|nr:hypothetical protein [Candidatus Lokiarchaeota archaeon]